MTPPPTTPAPGAVQPGTVPLADAIQAVWKQWHTVPFSNSDMTLAVSALGKARPQLPALCARVAALEAALAAILPYAQAHRSIPLGKAMEIGLEPVDLTELDNARALLNETAPGGSEQ